MNRNSRRIQLGLLVVAMIVLIVLPRIFTSGYVVNVMITAIRWTIFAMAFDLIAGHIGAVSLGQPIFYGIGAYTAAILGPKLGLGFWGNILAAAVLMGLLALVTGLAFFRIRNVTFAIGTLGAALTMQLIANSATQLTGGALCKSGIPRPQIWLPGLEQALTITKPLQYYYLLLPFLVISIIVYLALTRSRIGRAFTAVREDEIRASAVGIYPLRYKLVAFIASGALIGALGSWQAQYVTVVCPTELAQDLTTGLLIMVFVGGAGRLRGVILGALIFSMLPVILQVGGSSNFPPAIQQIIYGLILISVMLFLPDGLDGLITRLTHRSCRRKISEI